MAGVFSKQSVTGDARPARIWAHLGPRIERVHKRGALPIVLVLATPRQSALAPILQMRTERAHWA